jgi:hypothetical protein
MRPCERDTTNVLKRFSAINARRIQDHLAWVDHHAPQTRLAPRGISAKKPHAERVVEHRGHAPVDSRAVGRLIDGNLLRGIDQMRQPGPNVGSHGVLS